MIVFLWRQTPCLIRLDMRSGHIIAIPKISLPLQVHHMIFKSRSGVQVSCWNSPSSGSHAWLTRRLPSYQLVFSAQGECHLRLFTHNFYSWSSSGLLHCRPCSYARWSQSPSFFFFNTSTIHTVKSKVCLQREMYVCCLLTPLQNNQLISNTILIDSQFVIEHLNS